MTDGLCLYGDLNEVACDKCAEQDRACEKREDGSVGCKRCQYSKLGCSLINRKKKNTRNPKTPKQDAARELDGEIGRRMATDARRNRRRVYGAVGRPIG